MDVVEIQNKLRTVKSGARHLRSASSSKKNSVLERAARELVARQEEILKANRADIASCPSESPAFIDRLTLNESRIAQIAESLRAVAALPDPVGEEVEKRTLENGLLVRRVRAPLGVIYMIFESRPNVAIEAFSLGFKAGNGMILRGGKESSKTTAVLYQILSGALAGEGLPTECLWGLTNPDRAISDHLLQQKDFIDVVVPRGGDALINHVSKTSRIPIIKNDRGLCHVYVHEDADLEMARDIVVNSKTQRPGVCNSMETLLVHEKVAGKFIPMIRAAMPQVEVFDEAESSFDIEYLDLKMNSRVVKNLEEALEHISRHGSHHSEAIITRTAEVARHFEQEVDAAAVYWNASTRFTDGFALGLGGELGISTQKLHVRGPVGLRELTSPRWIIEGTGQVRK